MKKIIKIFALLLVVVSLFTACNGKTENTEKTNTESQTEKSEDKTETEPKKLSSLSEVMEQIALAKNFDAIAFLAEGYAFHLPLIQPEETDEVYSRTELKSFTVEFEGETLKEDPTGKFILSKPVEGLQKLKIKYSDGTERDIKVLFVRSYDFAVHPDSSELISSPIVDGVFSYYRVPNFIMSKPLANAQQAWSVLLTEAVSDSVAQINGMTEIGSSDYISTLDYELASDGKVLSLILVKNDGMAGLMDLTTTIKVRNVNLSDLAPLSNEEFLGIYKINKEELEKTVDEYLSKNPKLKLYGKEVSLQKPEFEDLESLVLFIKNGGIYINLAYTDETGNGGRIPVRVKELNK